MSDCKAVIFDMDGVIVDSEPRHERAFLEVLAEIGYGDRHGMRFADYIGRTDQDLWVDFVAKHKPAQPSEELLAMKRRRVVEILRRDQPLFDGLLELVEALGGQIPSRPCLRLRTDGRRGGARVEGVEEVLQRDGQRLGY